MKKNSLIIILGAIIVTIIFCFTCIVKFYNKTNQENVGNIINSEEFNVYGFNASKIESNTTSLNLELLEYDNTSKEQAGIVCVLDGYTTEPEIDYYIDIRDENNNILLIENEKVKIVGGIIETFYISKVNLNQEIVITVTEEYDNEIRDSLVGTINLSNLELFAKIDKTDKLQKDKIGDLEFEFFDYGDTYKGTTEHSYSQKLKGIYYSIPVRVQYGNTLINNEHIDITCEKNVNNLSLQEAYEDYCLINNNLGSYGLSDIYGIGVIRNDEYLDTVVLDFEEVLEICKGNTISKDGISYNKAYFGDSNYVKIYNGENVKIGNDIDAIKYVQEYSKEDYYMFVHGENIYYINVPKGERIEENIEDFLTSLKFE